MPAAREPLPALGKTAFSGNFFRALTAAKGCMAVGSHGGEHQFDGPLFRLYAVI